MSDGLIARLLRYRGIFARFQGVSLRPFLTGALVLAQRAVVAAGWSLDRWAYPALRRFQPRPPVFVIGNPRSGTTFLHRWLVAQGVGAGFELWQLLWPALSPRLLVRPVLGWLERVSPARFHGTKAHPTSLTSVETDDALLFFRFLDGLFAWGYFLAWDERDHEEALTSVFLADAPRDFAFLREAQRRNAFWHGRDRAVGKLFSACLRPDATLAAFPDAQFLFLVRDPVEVIPSGMSLVTGVLSRAYDLSRVPPEVRARYHARLYAASIRLYRTMAEAWISGRLPPERVKVVRYDRLLSSFEDEMREILTFIGHDVDPGLAVALRDTAARQRAWASDHRYAPEDFGLTAAQIRADCAFVYTTWGLP